MLIGELAQRSGVTAKTIRFYEQIGVLPEPERTASGYRDYGTEYLALLRFLRRARAAGLSLDQIQQIVLAHGRGEAPCARVQQMLQDRLRTVRADLAELTTPEAHLEALLNHARRGRPPQFDGSRTCWIIEAEV